MPRTAEDFLKAMIGQLVITNAQLAAQIETLEERDVDVSLENPGDKHRQRPHDASRKKNSEDKHAGAV